MNTGDGGGLQRRSAAPEHAHAGRVDESRALRAALARYRTRREWTSSADGAAWSARLQAHLAGVRTWSPVADADAGAAADAPARANDAARSAPHRAANELHVVHWNVLHGIAFDAVCGALRYEPSLAGADLVSLNEVDVGMARSGGRDVAFELASALGLHAAWAAQFLELHGGAHRARPAVVDPGAAWFGLALLSRYPLTDLRRLELPTPHDLLFDRERKAGAFVALVARVVHPVQPFTFAVVHLDVHGSPATRAQQLQAVLQALPAGPAIVAGDFNTTTFARGGAWRSARTLATLGLWTRARLRQRLLAPDRPAASPREPLFAALAAAGFALRPFNDARETLDVRFGDVHELDAFASWMRRPLLRVLGWIERRNVMRLDWIAARGFAAAAPPESLPHLMRGAAPASDHAPIAAHLRFD